MNSTVMAGADRRRDVVGGAVSGAAGTSPLPAATGAAPRPTAGPSPLPAATGAASRPTAGAEVSPVTAAAPEGSAGDCAAAALVVRLRVRVRPVVPAAVSSTWSAGAVAPSAGVVASAADPTAAGTASPSAWSA